MNNLEDNEVYLEKWYDICRDIYKTMSWKLTDMSPDMDDTLVNAWRRAEEKLNKEEWTLSTTMIYERITGKKPDSSTPAGRQRFNTFTSAYNKFCAENGFNASEGFPETQDQFFKYYLSNAPTSTAPNKLPARSVRFTSVPAITTLPNPPLSSLEDFPTLQAPTKAPISYASATSAFIPVTHHRCRKQTTNPLTEWHDLIPLTSRSDRREVPGIEATRHFSDM